MSQPSSLPDAPPRVVDTALVDDAVEILVGAFYSDPLWSWAMPDDRLRRAQHRQIWRFCVEAAIRHPWVWLTADGSATSVWIPPGASEFTDGQAELFEAMVVELLGAGAGRALAAFAALDEAHPRSSPHFYLSLLGTDPTRLGHGHGLGLLAANLRRIDELGAPAYLEASNLANVPLYARFGFTPLTTLTLPDGGPDVVTMWREGRAALT